MADQMMRMAGRDTLGRAKALRTDSNGILSVQMTSMKKSDTPALSADYRGKVAASLSENPNSAFIYGGDSIVKPVSFTTEFSQSRYDNVVTEGDSAVASNTSTVNTFYAQQLFRINALEQFKRQNKIPVSWGVQELKNNLKSMTLRWAGKGSGAAGVGAVVKYYNPSNDTLSEGKSQNVDSFNPVEFSTAELLNAIDNNGFIHIIVHASSASDGVKASTILTDFIGLKAVFTVEELVSTGTFGAELVGSASEEVKTLTANVLEQIYTPSVSNYGVMVIQNLDRYVPIEVVLNGAFQKPTNTTTTPNPDTFTNVHRIYPGQTVKFRSSPASVAYRSTAGSNVKLKVSCGFDVDYSPLASKQVFSDLDILRFRVLCADRLSNKVITHSGNSLYLSTNGGKTWTRQAVLASVPKTAFYTKKGTLIVSTVNHEILRSTDNGATFTTVMTNTYGWRGTDGISQNSVSGDIVFGENNTAPDSNLGLWLSKDDGLTWTEVLSRTTTQIRHWHSVQIDPYTGNWLATSGDFDHQVEWWLSPDGVNWRAIVGADSGVPGNQMYRTLGVFFTQNEFKWATDNPLWGYDENFMVSAKKDDVGVLSKDFPLSGPGYAHVQFPDLWIVGTQPEGSTMSDRTARIYVSKDNGNTWQIALSWRMQAGSVKGGFDWATVPDMDGNVYIKLSDLEGFSLDPWWYGTLKITI